ncbi:unnamed protein product [Mytilus coruscus]|uniref:OTU domain-containing protein n=1 Tax=Mytilus coruscus TaxID=42192 RepID=A0A6J8DQW9_MYTCO|nr:unnamed protein product [Mytilus coruscus]
MHENEFGMKDSDGKSLLLKLSNLDHLYQYCCNMMAGASQNQWFEVTGVSICIYVQEPESNIDYEHDELSQIHKPVIISDFEIPKIPETGNRNSDEFLKTLENNMLSDHISPEILKFNICSDNSNVFKENNEVHFDEGIMDNESDVEILSSSEMFYDFRPLNTFSKRKLCTIVKIPTKKISKLVTSNIYNMGSPSATKTITGDGNCLFRTISYALSNRQEYFGTLRKAIIDHLMTNAEMFKSFLQPRFKTVEEHIQTLRMEEGNVYRDALIQSQIKKYKDDKEYRVACIQSGIAKYHEDKDYRDALIQSGITKYHEDKDYRDALIQSGIEKYEENKEYREKLKLASVKKYADDDSQICNKTTNNKAS